MKNPPLLLLLASALPCGAAISLQNGNFNNGLTGWTQTGTPAVVGGAAVMGPSQGLLQDFAPLPTDGLTTFQADFTFALGQLSQAHRIRLEGDNGTDMISLSVTASATAGASSINYFNGGGSFSQGITGLTLATGTNYYLRVIGTGFGAAGRSYTLGFSTDGTNYTTVSTTNGFHNLSPAATLFETITFEAGGTAGSSLTVDNVTVTGTSIPEPAATTALCGAVGLLLLLRRRA